MTLETPNLPDNTFLLPTLCFFSAGPTVVRQNVGAVQNGRVEQARDRSLRDDVIRIETAPAPQQPDVPYVNTRQYVNVPGTLIINE